MTKPQLQTKEDKEKKTNFMDNLRYKENFNLVYSKFQLKGPDKYWDYQVDFGSK
jgi:hypothetical protein